MRIHLNYFKFSLFNKKKIFKTAFLLIFLFIGTNLNAQEDPYQFTGDWYVISGWTWCPNRS